MTSLRVRIVFVIDLMAVSMTTLDFACGYTPKTDAVKPYQLEKEKQFLLTEKLAKSFLHPPRRVRRGNDPTSECTESGGCDWEEVKEFYGNDPSRIKEFMNEFVCGSDCQSDRFTYCEITSTSYSHIYDVKHRCSRDGDWGAWGSLSSCSVTCGTGRKTRNRNCDNPAQMGGGDNCVGAASESMICVLAPCPVDGMWGPWGPWGACSVTCESGVKYRNRTCDNPVPNHGGNDCQGSARDSTTCTLSTCPVHGGWESWKSWSPCAIVNRNVRRTRCRTCTNPTPAHGGDYCPHRPRQSEYCDIPKSAVRRPCRCPISRIAEIKNISMEELIVLVQEIKDELAVDVSKLSKTIGKKVSAKDPRVSTQTIGIVGSIVLVIPFMLLISLDCTSLYRHVRNKQNEVRVLK